MEPKEVNKAVTIELARRSFWDFCQALAPDFYTDDRPHLITICDTLQKLYENRLFLLDGKQTKRLIMNIPPQHGKAIKIDTNVLTTNGFKKHGDLVVGDYVFNEKGKPVMVTFIHDKYLCSNPLSVNLDSLDSIVCSPEHEWVVEYNRDKIKTINGVRKRIGRELETVEAKNIFSGYNAKSPAIRLCEPLEFDKKDLPIDPYLFGAWLGDGSSKAGEFYAHAKDSYIYDKYSHASKEKDSCVRVSVHGILKHFRGLGVYKNKHIPEIYKTSSIDQRKELLKGLMDTDGTVNRDGTICEFCNTNKQLAYDVFYLVRSLGIKCSIRESDAKLYGRVISKKYRIAFTPNKSQELFKLNRKQDRINNKIKSDRIDKVRYFVKSTTKESECICNCITVEGGIYLVGDGLIPTHNSRTLINFASWVFGKNPSEKIITCSYNDRTASDFSRYTRDGICATKNMSDEIVYSEIFPRTKIKQGNSGFEKWALDGQHFSYLGAGIGGSITGKGASILIVDDPIKDASDAMNANVLESTWTWYTSTFRSRVSAKDGEPIEIINMTRWSINDLCGKILGDESLNKDWFVLSMKAYDEETDTMLCPSLLSKNRFLEQKSIMLPEIFAGNYMQEPFEAKGLLFPAKELIYFTPDEILKSNFESSLSYIDVADEGNDYTVMPVGKNIKNITYIVDAVCNKQNTDVTLPQCAEINRRQAVKMCRVEANAMGAMFLKALRKLLPNLMILGITSTANKHTRIIMEAGNIKKNFRFLASEFQSDAYKLMMKYLCAYKKEGKSEVDDPADAMSGLSVFVQGVLPHNY